MHGCWDDAKIEVFIMFYIHVIWGLFLILYFISIYLLYIYYIFICILNVFYLYHLFHCVKSVQIRRFFWSVLSRIRTEYGEILSVFSPNAGKYGPENTSYLDTFQAVFLFSYYLILNLCDNVFIFMICKQLL